MHASPVTFSGLLLLTAVIVVGAIVLSRLLGPVACRRRKAIRDRQHHHSSESSGILMAVAITGTLCIVVLLAAVGYWGLSRSVVQRSDDSRIVKLATNQSQQVQSAAAPELPLLQDYSATVHDMELLHQFSEADEIRFLTAVSEHVPSELRQVYALIPLSPPMPPGTTAGFQNVMMLDRLQPMVHALSTLMPELQPRVRQLVQQQTVLNNNGVRTMTLAQLPQTADSSETIAAELPEEVDLTVETEPPAWIEHPGVGRLVVQSRFSDSAAAPEAVLQPLVSDALADQITKHAAREYPVGETWRKLLSLHLSDAAVRRSVVSTYNRYQTIQTVEGPKQLRQTFALVEFPESVEAEALTQLTAVVQTNRMRALLIAVVTGWLGIVMLTFASRALRMTSRFRRLLTAGLLGLLMLPCAVICAATVVAMARGPIPPLQKTPVVYTVGTDLLSDAPVTASRQ